MPSFFVMAIIFFSVTLAQANSSGAWAPWSDLEPGLKYVLGQEICFPSNKQSVCHSAETPLLIESLDGGFGVPLMIVNAKSYTCANSDFTSEEILVLPKAASPGRDRRVIVQYGPACAWTIMIEVYDFYDSSFLRWPSYAEKPQPLF